MLQTHHAALSGLKRLAVLAVHGTKADVDHRGLRLYIAGLLCHTEHLLEVKLLTLIGNVNVLDRMEILLTLDDGSQIGGCVQGSTVRLAHDTRRQLLGVGRLGYVYNQSALALVCQTLVLQVLNQPRNILLRVTLAFPEFKMNVQIVVVSL